MGLLLLRDDASTSHTPYPLLDRRSTTRRQVRRNGMVTPPSHTAKRFRMVQRRHCKTGPKSQDQSSDSPSTISSSGSSGPTSTVSQEPRSATFDDGSYKPSAYSGDDGSYNPSTWTGDNGFYHSGSSTPTSTSSEVKSTAASGSPTSATDVFDSNKGRVKAVDTASPAGSETPASDPTSSSASSSPTPTATESSSSSGSSDGSSSADQQESSPEPATSDSSVPATSSDPSQSPAPEAADYSGTATLNLPSFSASISSKSISSSSASASGTGGATAGAAEQASGPNSSIASTSTKVAIGVSATFAVGAILVLLCFFFLRRQKQRQAQLKGSVKSEMASVPSSGRRFGLGRPRSQRSSFGNGGALMSVNEVSGLREGNGRRPSNPDPFADPDMLLPPLPTMPPATARSPSNQPFVQSNLRPHSGSSTGSYPSTYANSVHQPPVQPLFSNREQHPRDSAYLDDNSIIMFAGGSDVESDYGDARTAAIGRVDDHYYDDRGNSGIISAYGPMTGQSNDFTVSDFSEERMEAMRRHLTVEAEQQPGGQARY